MDDARSRRRVLGGVAAALGSGLAGCGELTGDGDGDGQVGIPKRWLPAPAEDEPVPPVGATDLRAVRDHRDGLPADLLDAVTFGLEVARPVVPSGDAEHVVAVGPHLGVLLGQFPVEPTAERTAGWGYSRTDAPEGWSRLTERRPGYEPADGVRSAWDPLAVGIREGAFIAVGAAPAAEDELPRDRLRRADGRLDRTIAAREGTGARLLSVADGLAECLDRVGTRAVLFADGAPPFERLYEPPSGLSAYVDGVSLDVPTVERETVYAFEPGTVDREAAAAHARRRAGTAGSNLRSDRSGRTVRVRWETAIGAVTFLRK